MNFDWNDLLHIAPTFGCIFIAGVILGYLVGMAHYKKLSDYANEKINALPTIKSDRSSKNTSS